jgi:hypothetical protein
MMIRETSEMIGKIQRQEVHSRFAVTFITDIENSTPGSPGKLERDGREHLGRSQI